MPRTIYPCNGKALEKIEKKLRKNNVQNTVTKEHIRVYKVYNVSNASNRTKKSETIKLNQLS